MTNCCRYSHLFVKYPIWLTSEISSRSIKEWFWPIERYDMQKVSFVAIGLLLMVGCRSLRDDMTSWIGRSGDELVSAWGTPTASVNLDDGRRVITWTHHWKDEKWRLSHYCRKSFTLSAKGIVEDWVVENCPGSLRVLSYDEAELEEKKKAGRKGGERREK
jgi:hypothetical protein